MDAPYFDFGLLTFGASCLSSTYLLGIANHKAQPQCTTRLLAVGSYGLVAINYALGLYAGIVYMNRPGFALYCGIFTIVWVAIAIIGNHLAGSKPNATFSSHESAHLVV